MDKELLMRGVRRCELLDFFQELGGVCVTDGRVEGDGYLVQLGEETEVFVGSLCLPEVRVRIKGDRGPEVERSLFFRFLRGGG